MNIYIKNLNDYILRKNQDLLMELYEKKDKPAVAFFNMVDQALACQFHDKRQQEYIDIKSQQEYIKNILEDIELTPNTFYYSDDRSSKNCAHIHFEYMQNTSRGVTLKLSIKNFGNPVTTKQFKTIIKEEFPRFQPDIINFMTNICFPNDFLPQNACTSPIIASLCFKQVDKKLINYIEKRGGVYTRYMNELFFSFQEANVSAEKILLFIKKQLSINGYILNERQTSIMRTRQKQSVLGINIGEVFQTSKKFRRNIRKDVHFFLKYGTDDLKFKAKLLKNVEFALYINPDDLEMRIYNLVLSNPFSCIGDIPNTKLMYKENNQLSKETKVNIIIDYIKRVNLCYNVFSLEETIYFNLKKRNVKGLAAVNENGKITVRISKSDNLDRSKVFNTLELLHTVKKIEEQIPLVIENYPNEKNYLENKIISQQNLSHFLYKLNNEKDMFFMYESANNLLLCCNKGREYLIKWEFDDDIRSIVMTAVVDMQLQKELAKYIVEKIRCKYNSNQWCKFSLTEDWILMWTRLSNVMKEKDYDYMLYEALVNTALNIGFLE